MQTVSSRLDADRLAFCAPGAGRAFEAAGESLKSIVAAASRSLAADPKQQQHRVEIDIEVILPGGFHDHRHDSQVCLLLTDVGLEERPAG